ncbi:hypothetical protein P3T36_002144 [Kitasatospora sp. MAP12-15]|nr:hypothetical protein [Kitasatospora sp. MAP12-44]
MKLKLAILSLISIFALAGWVGSATPAASAGHVAAGSATAPMAPGDVIWQ